jgi:integrase/recombinase XerD
MRHDLAAARAQWIKEAKTPEETERRVKSDFLRYRDSAGLFADFHANRHTFISNLIQTGADPKTAQVLARHASIGLTMDRYTHLGMGARVSAILALPSPESLNAAAMASSAADDAGLAPAVEGGDLVTKFVTTSDQKSAEQVSPDGMELTPFGVITVGCTIAAATTTRERKPLWQNEFDVSCQDVTPIAASMRGGEEKVHPTGLEPVTFGSVDRCSIQLS